MSEAPREHHEELPPRDALALTVLNCATLIRRARILYRDTLTPGLDARVSDLHAAMFDLLAELDPQGAEEEACRL